MGSAEEWSIAAAVSGRGLGMGRGQGLVRAGFDGGVDRDQFRKGSRSQVLDESGLDAGPGVVNRAGVFPVAGTIAQDAVLEGRGSFGGFYDVEKADIAGVSSQAIASVRPVGGFQQPLRDEPGQDQGQGLVRDVHLGGDLTGLTETGLVVPSDRDHGSDGVVAFSSETELHRPPRILSQNLQVALEFQFKFRTPNLC